MFKNAQQFVRLIYIRGFTLVSLGLTEMKSVLLRGCYNHDSSNVLIRASMIPGVTPVTQRGCFIITPPGCNTCNTARVFYHYTTRL